MRIALTSLAALVIASTCVGAIWALAATLMSGAASFEALVSMWAMVSAAVFGVILLPASLLIQKGPDGPRLGLASGMGALLGAVLFAPFCP